MLGRRREGQAPFRVGSRTGGNKEGAGRPRQLLGQRRDVGTAARGRHDLLGRAPRDVVVGLRACGRAGRRPRWGAGRPARHTPGATAADPTLPDGLAPPPGRCSPTEASDEQAGEARCAGGQSPQVKAGCLGSLCGGAQARPTPASLLRPGQPQRPSSGSPPARARDERGLAPAFRTRLDPGGGQGLDVRGWVGPQSGREGWLSP